MIASSPRPSAVAAGPVAAGLLTATMLLTAVHLGGAEPAHAHAGLVSSSPASRDELRAMPSEEDMNRPSYVTVTAPDRTVVAEGEVTSSTWWWVALVALPWIALVALLLQRRRRTEADHD